MKKKREYHMYSREEDLGTPIHGRFGSEGWVDGQLDISRKLAKGQGNPNELYRYLRWHTFKCKVEGCDIVDFRIGGKQTRCPKHQAEFRKEYHRKYNRKWMRKWRRKG